VHHNPTKPKTPTAYPRALSLRSERFGSRSLQPDPEASTQPGSANPRYHETQLSDGSVVRTQLILELGII